MPNRTLHLNIGRDRGLRFSLLPFLATTLLVAGLPLVLDDPAAIRLAAPCEYAEGGSEEAEEGYAPSKAIQVPRTIEAAFPRESYPPRSTARLILWTPRRRLTMRVIQVGPETIPTKNNAVINGVPIGDARDLGVRRAGSRIRVSIGDWPSGLYAVELRAPHGWRGFAPFVVRPRRLGEHQVAVVLPTQTWQAYNFHDDNRDGQPDTWYAGWRTNVARLGRPFMNRGVPTGFRHYDLHFLQWLARKKHEVDVLTDADLDRTRSARRLAHAYALIVFPGHHEYVTEREYDVVTRYRDLGGNLMFLSANNFYWKVVRRGNVMQRVVRWREIGRPEAALIGVQYRANDDGRHRGAWIVRETPTTTWLFAGTGLRTGSALSNGGIEVDHTAPSSPRATHVVAEIPNIFRRGITAQMTYYETRGGARVFAAGAFTIAGSALQPPVSQVLERLWTRMSTREEDRHAAPTAAPVASVRPSIACGAGS